MLDPDGEAHERLRNLEGRARDARVGHRPGNLDQGFDAAERFCQSETLESVDEVLDAMDSASNLEAHHSAKAVLLFRGDDGVRKTRSVVGHISAQRRGGETSSAEFWQADCS